MSAHIKYAYLNKTAIRFQFLFHHLSTADYTNEPVYVVVVSAGLLFFASSWDFGFFFLLAKVNRARARSLIRSPAFSVCACRDLYICVAVIVYVWLRCVVVCPAVIVGFVLIILRRCTCECVCVFAIPSNFPYALQFLRVQSNASAQSAHTTYVSSSGCFVCVLCCSVCVCMLCALVRLGSLKMSNRQYEICLLPASAISHRCVSL